jgi:hypothetical protein
MDNTNQYQYKLTKYRHLSKNNPNNPVYANKIQKYQTLLQVSQIQQGGVSLDFVNNPEFKKITDTLKDLNITDFINKLSNTISGLFDPKKIEEVYKLLQPILNPKPNN